MMGSNPVGSTSNAPIRLSDSSGLHPSQLLEENHLSYFITPIIALLLAGCKPTEAALADLTVEQRPTGLSVELLIRSKHGAIVHDDEFGTVFMVGDAEDSTDEFIRITAPRYWKDKKYFQ